MITIPRSSVANLVVAEGIAQVVVDAPPVNALSAAVRGALVEMIEWADAHEDIGAIVIRCAGRTFFAGADIREFGLPVAEPHLPDVVDRIESCRKPVVAAIHGQALGGGLEIALGCHFRIAVPDSKLGFPEVTLGLIPGAGGTQRLPRLVPITDALSLLTTGKPIAADMACAIGLVDRVVDGDLEDEAVTFAKKMAAIKAPLVRASERDSLLVAARADMGLFDRFLASNAKKFRGLDAPYAAVTAARAALERPFTEGQALERKAFLQLRNGPQSAALRHLFFAEREAARVPGLSAEITGRPIRSAGIIGAGTMGSGIAINLLLAQIPVVLLEMQREALDRGVHTIEKTLQQSVTSGRIDADRASRARALLAPSLRYADLADVDLAIEAAYETMAVKQEIFARLDSVAKPGAILATNTSYLNVDEIAAITKRPQDVLGLHFFSPANIMKLLEIVKAEKTSDDVLVTGLEFAKRIGKVAVVAGVAHGFIGNRMLHARRKACERLLLGGIDPYRIDKVLEDFGMPMGPFRMYDLAGLDLGWSPEQSTGATIQERLCEQGRRGQKTHAGYYDYDEDRKPVPAQPVLTLIDEFVREKEHPRLDLSDDEILAWAIFPMINEGFQILDEGKAYRESDIDVVWVNGYGWPAYRGGPMYWAVQTGLPRIVSALTEMDPEFKLAEGLKRMAQPE